MNTFWKILELKETRDLNLIKNAYRTKLPLVNPEEDEQGFKELRAAYEAALSWVNGLVGEKEDKVQKASAVNEWMERVNEVYSNFFKRIDEYSWKVLLKEEVCIHLDTGNEIREALLNFLTEHYRLPHKIFKLLDDFFSFTAEKQELYEKYPKNFVDFLERAVLNEDFLDYILFNGGEDGDYDGFISCFYELMKSLEEEDTTVILELLNQCKDYFIYHPYLVVEEARYYIKIKEYEKAKKILTDLVEEYPKDIYMLYFLAEVTHKSGNIEEACDYYEKLLILYPSHYSAKIGMAECFFKKEDYEIAKEYYIDILESYPGDTSANDGLVKVNEILIVKYQKEYFKNKAGIEAGLELSWCYYQNLRYEECIRLLDNLEADKEYALEYCNLKGRALLYSNEYEKALSWLLKWLKGLENIPNEEAEGNKKKKRIGYANLAISGAYEGMAGKGKSDSEREVYLNKALDYARDAIEKEKGGFGKLACRNQKAKILFQLGLYEACASECDGIIKECETYYPAFIQRQEAYYKLERYQSIIDDFYHIMELYPKNPKTYLLTARTYADFGQYEEVLYIIQKAEEYEVALDELTLLKAKAIRCTAKEEKEIREAYKLLEELKIKFKEGSTDLEVFGDLWLERALCLKDLKKLREALEEINTAVYNYPSEGDYLYCKGNILYEMNNYKEAKNIYTVLLNNYPESGSVLFKLGRVSEYLGDRKGALMYYEKVLQFEPEHDSVHYYIAEIYETIGEETEDDSYYEKSLEYRINQVKVEPSDYNYTERGLTYAALERFYEAINDYKKSIELNPNSPYPYNNIGILYKYQEQYEEAITYYKEAVKYLVEEKTSLPYNNMASCYMILQEYEKAEECYKHNIKLFPEEISSYTLLAALYRRMKQYDKAISCYQEILSKQPREGQSEILLKIAGTYGEWQYGKKALFYYKKALRLSTNDPKIYKGLANFFFYEKGSGKKAVRYYKKAAELYEAETTKAFECLIDLGVVYHYLGNKQKAEEFFGRVLEGYRKKYISLEKYLGRNGFEPIRCYNVGRIYLYLGNLTKAEELFERMISSRKCNFCKYKECVKAFIGRGLVYEYKKDVNKALTCYKIALDYDANNSFCRYALKRLKRLS